MTKFADHLYESLMAEHGDALRGAAAQAQAQAHAEARARRRVTRPVWASAGTVAAAAAAAVGFTVFGGTASAYAVTDNHDGTLTVKVTKPSGIAGANSELKKMGSRVAVVEAKPGCPSIDTFATPGHGGRTDVTVQLSGGDPNAITVSASGLPADETALVVYSFDHGKGSTGMVPVKGKVPTCVSLPAVPPPGSVVTQGNGGKQDGPGANAEKLDSTSGSGGPGLSQQTK
jgi:multidrug efflux pump subunit AcrA (membrane-fusion protein)